MSDLSLINMANIPHDRAGLGSTVVIFDNSKNEEIEYKLVTSEESDVTKGQISTTSPIGRALINKKSRRHCHHRHAWRQSRNRNPEAHHHDDIVE